MQEVLNYILSLGSTVFVPIVLMIIGLIFGLGLFKSIKAGITVGVGFVGFNLAVGLISSALDPAVTLIIERIGLNLTVMDLGSGAGAGVAFSTVVGALIIPAVFALNVVLILIGATKTFNIDIFNYSHYAFSGAVVHNITGNLGLGMAAALIQATWSLLSADYSAKRVQSELGVDSVSIPQGYASSSVPLFAILDKIYDKIPALRDSKLDIKGLQEKIGFFGDPVIVGVILGIILSLLSGYNFADSANLVMSVCAILILFPRMIKIIVEGLLPLSEAAKKFFAKHFSGRELFIGLDSAITLGHPTTVIIGTLLIPITLVLAAILPGNKVLPLADLAFAAFFLCMATVIHRGNIMKTLISGTLNMIGILYLATWFAPQFTDLAIQGGLAQPGNSVSALWAGNVFMAVIAKVGSFGILGIAALIIFTIIMVFYVKKNALKD
ncbi:PTS galactitol transporter subunit IIC [Erysipelothrix sp. HDW6A]|uniref:PTS galactitol transporter subunit IIC n=1 Tax=Erysipelothrix sp. HDW6A TaxID=2714928 RepID=UPI00140721D6|nr:PTS transporter subunit IIC [Erysipelothrix sp. HDW6A]QIK58194.1 PTS galactitol transporter subunit IIC [Erysipelothrix sp. HDW6A]